MDLLTDDDLRYYCESLNYLELQIFVSLNKRCFNVGHKLLDLRTIILRDHLWFMLAFRPDELLDVSEIRYDGSGIKVDIGINFRKVLNTNIVCNELRYDEIEYIMGYL